MWLTRDKQKFDGLCEYVVWDGKPIRLYIGFWAQGNANILTKFTECPDGYHVKPGGIVEWFGVKKKSIIPRIEDMGLNVGKRGYSRDTHDLNVIGFSSIVRGEIISVLNIAALPTQLSSQLCYWNRKGNAIAILNPTDAELKKHGFDAHLFYDWGIDIRAPKGLVSIRLISDCLWIEGLNVY